MSEAFSPIMMIGPLVLPDIRVGIIDPSATRSPSRPRTLSSGSTTAICVGAHLARAYRVIGGLRVGADVVEDLLVTLHVGSGG